MNQATMSGRFAALLLPLALLAVTDARASSTIEIAQAGGNERIPGGVEHAPVFVSPDSGAAPAAMPPPAPEPAPAAPKSTPVAPPVEPPSDAGPDSQIKKNVTKPVGTLKEKSKSYSIERSMSPPDSVGVPDSSQDQEKGGGGDERHPGGVEHKPSNGQ